MVRSLCERSRGRAERRQLTDGVSRADFAGLGKIRLIHNEEMKCWLIPVPGIAEAIDWDQKALQRVIKQEQEVFAGVS